MLNQREHRFEAVAAEIFDPIQRYLRRRASADDAEEALSDVLLVVWRRFDEVPDANPLPWCYGVARRVLANRHRAGRRRKALIERLTATAEAATEAPDLSHVGEALDGLREDDREVLRLWAWERLEPREIAVALGVTPNAASQRLAKAKDRLAREIDRHDVARGGHNTGRETGRRS